jgi:hypothetical protein
LDKADDDDDDGVLVPVVPIDEEHEEVVEDVQFVSDTVFAVSLSLHTTTVRCCRDPVLPLFSALVAVRLCFTPLALTVARLSLALSLSLSVCVCVCV